MYGLTFVINTNICRWTGSKSHILPPSILKIQKMARFRAFPPLPFVFTMVLCHAITFGNFMMENSLGKAEDTLTHANPND